MGFYIYCCCCCLVAQSCLTLCNPMDYNPPASLSTEFSRQEYWSGLPCPPPRRRSSSFRVYRVIEEGFIVIEPWFFHWAHDLPEKKKFPASFANDSDYNTMFYSGNVNVRYRFKRESACTLFSLFFNASSSVLLPKMQVWWLEP